jgi:hypothetical protein
MIPLLFNNLEGYTAVREYKMILIDQTYTRENTKENFVLEESDVSNGLMAAAGENMVKTW